MNGYIKNKMLLMKLIILAVEEISTDGGMVSSRKKFLDVLNQYALGANRMYTLEQIFDIGLDDVIYSVIDLDDEQ